MDQQPLILTLKLDAQTFAYFDGLRRQHFPPHRNIVPAHITLFHALPAEHEFAIDATLREVSAETAPTGLAFPALRFLGRGVAAEVDAPDLLHVRARLAAAWDNRLGAQDRQRYRPHITIQNKVAPKVARELLSQMESRFEQRPLAIAGLGLHRYLGGPWEKLAILPFRGR